MNRSRVLLRASGLAAFVGVFVLLPARPAPSAPFVPRGPFPAPSARIPMLELRGAAAELAVAAGGTAVTLGFGLYDARHGGLRLWAQPAAQVLLVEGIWTVTLGEPPAPVLDESVLASPSLWLEIRLDGKPAGPRRKVRKVSGVLTIEGNLLSAPGPDGDKRASRSRHFYAQRAYPLEATPPGVLSRARSARAAARRTRGALASPRLRGALASAPDTGVTAGAPTAPGVESLAASGGTWQFIGPMPVLAGQTRGLRGPVSGRVTALAVSPGDPSTVFAAGAQGGVWRSTDGGASWAPMTDGLPSLAMGAIGIAASRPEVIYIGTGEAQSSIDSYYGAGVFKSTDGGVTWEPTAPLDASYISRLVVHPADPDRAYVAGYRYRNGGISYDSGIWRTSDGGATWTRVLAGAASDLLIHPDDPSILYAALGYIWGSPSNGIYRSADGGDSWVRLGSGLPTGEIGRVRIDISRSDPAMLYASMQRLPDFRLHGIFRSQDGGETWTQAANTGGVAHCAAQCWYDMYVAVAPDDPLTLYFGGLDLSRSRDGGGRFDNISAGGAGGGLHVDQHALAFHPEDPGTYYVGNDGGIWKTTDAGATWINLNEGLGITQFQSVAAHPTDPDVAYGGTQDNGTNKFAGDPEWVHVRDGDGGATLVDFSSPGTIYHTFYNITFERSDDAGATWLTRQNGLNPTGADRSLFYPPVEMDPTAAEVLYFGTNRLYRSLDRGDFWSAISPDLTRGAGSISAIAVGPGDPRILWVGTSDGYVRRSIDAGATWSNLTRAPLPNRFVTGIAADPANPDVVWISYSGFDAATPAAPGHVFRTVDSGATWQAVGGGLPDTPINAVMLDPLSSRIVYLATDLGVMVSTNDGWTWAYHDEGLPHVAVLDLALPAGTGMLHAATHGRSMFARPGCTASGSPDTDQDAIADDCDNCPWMANLGQEDLDADGAGAVCDCDEIQASAVEAPALLELTSDGGLVWKGPDGAIAHNIHRGSFSSDGPLAWNHACLASGLPVPAGHDPGSPVPGEGFYYLVSGRFCSGDGPLGAGSQGAGRPAGAPCS